MNGAIVEPINEWAVEAVHRQASLLAVRLLERRFGTLSEEFCISIDQLSIDTLNELALATLDFKDVAEAQAWVAQHRQTPVDAT